MTFVHLPFNVFRGTVSKLKLQFGNVGFWGEGKTVVPGEKPLRAEKRTNKNLNPQPTYDARSGNRTRDTLVGGERSHRSAIPALQYCNNHFRQFCFQSEVKGMYIYKFFSYTYVHGDGEGKLQSVTWGGSSPRSKPYLSFNIDVASSLKPLSKTYCGPSRSHFLDK